MKNFKNKVVLTVLIGSIILPLLALAQGGIPPVPPLESIGLDSIITRVINWMLGLLIALAAIFIMVAAFYYLTSSGDEEKLKSAKNLIIYAVVAIAVGAISKLLVTIVVRLLGLNVINLSN